MEKRFLTTKQSAEFLQLKISYLYKMIMLKKFPTYKPAGGKVYLLESDLLAWIESGRQLSESEINDTAKSYSRGK